MHIAASSAPTTPAIGDVFIDSTDSNKLKWYDGSAWQTTGGTTDNTKVAKTGDTMSGNLTVAKSVLTDTSTAVEHSAGSGYSGTISAVSSAGDTMAPFHAAVYGGTNNNKTFALIGERRPNSSWGTTVNPISNGEYLPGLGFAGQTNSTSGTGMVMGAAINAVVNGTVSSGVMPTDIVFQTSTTNSAGLTEQMRITSGGSVGIGTTNPNSLLTVEGGMTLKQQASDPTGTASYGSLYSKTDGKLYYRNGTGTITDLTGGGGGTGDFKADGTVPMTGNIQLNGHYLSGDGGSEGVYVDSSGNVGIGTAAPENNLQVYNGSVAVTNSDNWNSMFLYTASDNKNGTFQIMRSRGTTSSPTYPNSGDVLGDIKFMNWNAGDGATIEGIATQTHTGSAGGSALTFRPIPNGATAAVEAMRIDQNGNVGIGTTIPSEKLEVVGKVKATELCIGTDCKSAWPSGGGSLTDFTEGVNTSSPNATVPVVSLTATNAASNVDVALRPKGTGALTAQIADGTATGGNKRGANAVDWQTSRSDKTLVASGEFATIAGGDGNMASGYASFATGQSNSATGYYSFVGGGGNTASGDNSFAMGNGTTASGFDSFTANRGTVAGSLAQTTFGTYNAAITGDAENWVSTDPLFVIGNGSSYGSRSNAMTILKNGSVGIGTTNPSEKLEVAGNVKMTGVGNGITFPDGTTQTTAATGGGASSIDGLSDAIYNSTTGSLALGEFAAIGTGSSNVAVGRAALNSITNGTDNIAVGNEALNQISTGDKNIALGTYALTAASTGNGNIGIGYGALINSSGSSNIALGADTGVSNLGSGSGNILIGNSADVPTANASDVLNIGNVIYGDLSSGGVGVGVMPNSRLTVDGVTALKETNAPSATANYGKLYVKSSDSKLYFMNDSGAETELGASGGGGAPGGSNTQVQFNNSGSLAGDSNFIWDSSNKSLVIGSGGSYAIPYPVGSASISFGDGHSGLYLDPDGNLNMSTPGDLYLGTEGSIGGTTIGGGHLTLNSSDYTELNSTGGLYITSDPGGANHKFVFDYSGNVGIGTTSPNSKLTVEGVTALKETTAPTSTANYGKLYVKSSDHKLYFINASGTETELGADGGGGTPGGANTQIQFNNAGAFGGSSNLTWDNTHKALYVGAGPAITYNGDAFLGFGDGTGAIFRSGADMNFQSSGNTSIGSGTINPLNLVAGGGDPGVAGVNIGAGSAPSIATFDYDGVTFSRVADGTPGFRFDYDGDVGIGTTSPNALLTVEGATTLRQIASDPTGTANYGSLYTKTDGKLYYRDGTGTITDLSGGGGSFDPSQITADLVPQTDLTYSIGSPSSTWSNGYFQDGHFEDLYVSGTTNANFVNADQISLTSFVISPNYFSDSNGSAGAPAISRLTDTNTGLFFPGADLLGLSTGGTERLRIDSSGNIGIGTTNPQTKLHIQMTDGTEGFRIENTDSTVARWPSVTVSNFRGAVDTNGYPVYHLIASRGTKAAPTPVQSGDSLGQIQFWGAKDSAGYSARGATISAFARETFGTSTAATDLTFSTAPSGGADATAYERMRISSTGNVGIGTTSPQRLLHVNGPMRITASALPGTPATGDIAIDSGDSNKLKWYDGSGWQAAGGSGGGGGMAGSADITGSSYTITSGQSGYYFTYNGSSAGTINLPAISGLSDGFQVTIMRQVAQSVTITANGSDSLPSGLATLEMRGQNMQSVTLTKMGSKWNITNKTDDCIVGQSCWGTNNLYIGTYNGHQYFTTPGGCTNSGTPTCAGGADTVTKAWASSAPESSTSLGLTNFVDGQAQSSTLAGYTTAAAAQFCENMTYAGYTDWYLPSRQELNLLYQKSGELGSIGGFNYSSNYWSSTENNTSYAWYFLFHNGYANYTNKTSAYYVRCVRRF
jgi:hypothetical protein